MPLPTEDQIWPPTDIAIQAALADWDAWYSSDPARLSARYYLRTDGSYRDVPINRPIQSRGGVVGRLARWFWGTPIPEGEKNAKVHIPLAGDIARTSSELLFSEPPKLISTNSATQERLEDLTASGLHPTLLEAGEVGAALGGSYLRIVWDETVSDEPWIDAVGADQAIPEFRYNRLVAVTFWTVVQDEHQVVLRHLERHERGVIYHGLYQGTRTHLGHPVPLTEHPSTAPLADEVNAQGALDTGAPKNMTAVYIPNVRPARAWRNNPAAAGWGQSDFQGIEGIMDALDETWSSWMRDIRNGKGRVVVPNSMLDAAGPGQGSLWNADREIYTGLNMLARAGDAGKLDVVQFNIRVEEHRDTATELLEHAVRQAGYSGASFGLDGDGSAVTATEIRARTRRSMATRARKALYAGPAIADITAAWLAVLSGFRFKASGLDLEPPVVEFADSITESPQEVATTVQLLAAAEAASTAVRVAMVHPDWTDDQVRDEVAAIHSETAVAPLMNPEDVGGPPPPPDDGSQQDPAAA